MRWDRCGTGQAGAVGQGSHGAGATVLTLHLSLPPSVELEEPPRVRTAARLFQQTCYRYREELSAGVIVAGWDPRRGGQVGPSAPEMSPSAPWHLTCYPRVSHCTPQHPLLSSYCPPCA
uniref:Uncharacterized protein n=1 Tax=Falco tinnunculus TaxID=100819 RepID=A0A8C4TUX4_FALTI